MIEKNHPSLSVGAQCRLLSISRSSFYYELMGETVMNLDLMVVIDKQFLETPFCGVQQMPATRGHPQKGSRRLATVAIPEKSSTAALPSQFFASRSPIMPLGMSATILPPQPTIAGR